MASIYTHDKFGRLLMKKMPEVSCGLTNRILFQFGNQGPDFFFFNTKLKIDGKNPGTTIHDRPFYDYLDRNKDFVKSLDKSSDEYFYFVGSICHFILDSFIHPTVESLVTNDYSHMDIEIELDRYYMLLDGKDPHRYKLQSLIPEANYAPKIIPFYKSYGVKLKDVYHSLKGFKKYRTLFHTSTKVKEIFLVLLMKIIGKSEFTGQLLTYKVRPQSKKANEILNEKFEFALDEGPRLLKNALNYIFIDEELDPHFKKDYMGEIR